MSTCKHCGKPIEWHRNFQAWVHIHNGVLLCLDLSATPKETP